MIKSDRAYRKEYVEILKACSDFGFSDTEDVPLSAIVRSAFSTLTEKNRCRDTSRSALNLAKEATNGWACYAKKPIEHENIANLHQRIATLESEID